MERRKDTWLRKVMVWRLLRDGLFNKSKDCGRDGKKHEMIIMETTVQCFPMKTLLVGEDVMEEILQDIGSLGEL